jgi:hypothetical protein
MIVISFWPFFMYGDNNNTCAACGSPSPETINMIDFSNQIIDILPNNSTLITQWRQYRVFWPRQWWVYNGILSSQNSSSILWNIVWGTLKNFDKRQSYIRATTELLGIYSAGILKDGWLGFLAASQPFAIIRDYQLLLDIDTLVGDKIYEIGIAWWYSKPLEDNQLTQIKTLIQNNSGKWKIFTENIDISDSLTSTQLLSLLLRLNNRFKKILVLWWWLPDSTITVWWWSKTIVELNEEYFSWLQQNYSCTRIGTSWKTCGSSFIVFKKNIKNIISWFGEKWPKQSLEKINIASKRLVTRALQITNQTDSDFYKNNIDDYTQREQELLSALWQTKRTWSLRSVIKWWLSSNIPRKLMNIYKETKWIINNIGSVISWIWSYTKDLTQNITSEKLKQLLSYPDRKEYILQLPASPQQSNITQLLRSISNEQTNIITTQINNTTSDTQEALSMTLTTIRIINTILYNNIREDIARTCELQCSNLWWICR